jgi:hypothetical protein
LTFEYQMLVWWYLTSVMMEYLSVITVFIDLGW